MPTTKEKILSVSGSFLGVGIGVAATIGQKLLEAGNNPDLLLYSSMAVAGGVAVNLLSNVAHDICSALPKKIFSTHPNELNHGLQKLMAKAVKRCLNNILVLYKDENPSGHDYTIAKDFINQTIKTTDGSIRSIGEYAGFDEKLNLYIHTPVAEAYEQIVHQLTNELSAFHLPQRFITLINERITDQLRLCFTEELKKEENQTAWIAFQKMMLESLKKDVESILASQQRLEKGMEGLKQQHTFREVTRLSPKKTKSLENLLKEINQPQRLQLQLDQALDQMLSSIHKELASLIKITGSTYDEVKQLRSDFHKQKVHWLSSKMVLAYAITMLLVIAIVLLSNYYAHQPFNVTVAVYGPGGKNDIVLKNRGTIVLQYGNKTEKSTLNEQGEAYFKQIPGIYKEKPASISLVNIEGEPYQPLCGDSCTFLLKDETFYIPLKMVHLDKISGLVVDERRKPIAGAQVMVLDLNTLTDENGLFQIKVPPTRQQRLQDITVIKKGYKEETVRQLPPHLQMKPVEIRLTKN